MDRRIGRDTGWKYLGFHHSWWRNVLKRKNGRCKSSKSMLWAYLWEKWESRFDLKNQIHGSRRHEIYNCNAGTKSNTVKWSVWSASRYLWCNRRTGWGAWCFLHRTLRCNFVYRYDGCQNACQRKLLGRRSEGRHRRAENYRRSGCAGYGTC